jgi:probable HAF family extracellular repeat protein
LRNSDGSISSFTIVGFSILQLNAMNNWGTTIGSFLDANPTTDLYLRYSGGGKKYIFGSSHGAVEPAAINDNGIVVGTDHEGDNFYGNAFSLDRSLTLTLIPVPFTAQGTTANAINNAGQIVGTYIDANGARHGWIYLP